MPCVQDQLTLYLASCIAATAHDYDKKSAPKGERKRHRQLCETAADIIRGRALLPAHALQNDADSVAKNLEVMAAMLRRYE